MNNWTISINYMISLSSPYINLCNPYWRCLVFMQTQVSVGMSFYGCRWVWYYCYKFSSPCYLGRNLLSASLPGEAEDVWALQIHVNNSLWRGVKWEIGHKYAGNQAVDFPSPSTIGPIYFRLNYM